MNDVILNKKVSIERCIHQINAYYALDSGMPFDKDFLRQDAIAMNLQRICELAIDVANHLIKIKKLGLPQDSRDSFALLERAGLIGPEQMNQPARRRLRPTGGIHLRAGGGVPEVWWRNSVICGESILRNG